MHWYNEQVRLISEKLYKNRHQLQKAMRLKAYLDNNYGEAANLICIAGANFQSRFHMIRVFKKYYGQTPHQYLTGVRIEKARAFLDSGLSVTETCFHLGFQSVTSFTALFKKYTGISPSAYRKKRNF